LRKFGAILQTYYILILTDQCEEAATPSYA